MLPLRGHTSRMQLDGKTVLITGSTDGVARRVAERLGAMGAHVLVHGRDQNRGKAVAEAVGKAGGTAGVYQADLSAPTRRRGRPHAQGEGAGLSD
jgi:NAD(P)-dependent dehydrogenase (short-subunit alcohol dehydrogenase family)